MPTKEKPVTPAIKKISEDTILELTHYLSSKYANMTPKFRGMDLSAMNKIIEVAIVNGLKSYAEEVTVRKIPNPIPKGWLEQQYFKGEMVRLSDLVDGCWYYGKCRHADMAMWDADAEVFVYYREKFGYVFPETIKHPEQDNGQDLFWPRFLVEDLRGTK